MKNRNEIETYMSKQDFEDIIEFSKGKETPFLVLNLSKISKKYDELKNNLPLAKIYFAVKACPINEVIKLLDDKGSYFDIASTFELDLLLNLGVNPDKISYGNTIKKESDIEYAYQKGVKLFATDSNSDLNKIALKAPGSRVFFRILSEGGHADWPLSKKFGAHPDTIYKLILESKKLNVIPVGISFHVGSQQRDIGQWDNAISQTKYLFESIKAKGIDLKLINLGGGFPGNYLNPAQSITDYCREISQYLTEDFGNELPEIIIEPGRSLVADAGTIVSEIILISKKYRSAPVHWVYLDIGKFGGLAETTGEAIKYPIFTESFDSIKPNEVILAGPTCDSADILYEDFKYKLPKDVKEGDKIYILATGAYTKSYSSTSFNGFPPLAHYIIK